MTIRSLIRSVKNALTTAHDPLITIGISRENLLHNLYTYQQQYPGLAFAPVLKSNAYGHVAELLDKENIAFLMVDSLFEARTLRKHGIRSCIVVMGYVRPAQIAENCLPRIDFAITDIEQLRELSRIAVRPIHIQLKVDTGMHRQGIPPELQDEAVALIQRNLHLSLVGLCSHFADADNADPAFSKKQLAAWHQARARFDAKFPTIEYRHIAATKGVRFAQEAGTNVARLGMGLYGYDPAPEHTHDLRPVLEMHSLIASVRTLEQGGSVGYNSTYVAPAPERLATVPVGYFEGIDRRLSNLGSLQVRDVLCPIRGRVSMNMCSLDVSAIPDVAVGDEVLVISRDPEAPNSARSMAAMAQESVYVILAHLPPHLKRVVE
jgi:alanine racemase